MLNRFILLCIICSFIQPRGFGQAGEEIPSSILVKFRSASDMDKAVNLNARRMTPSSNIQRVSDRKQILKFSYKDGLEATRAKNAFELMPEVETVVYNYPLYKRGGTNNPNDPQFSDQWNLLRIGLPTIWDRTTGGLTPCGDTIVVAVFDFGFDMEHEDMQGLLWHNKDEIPNNGFDDDQNGYVDDYNGLNLDTDNDRHAIDSSEYHGTSVSGVIAANTDNSLGGAGINWNIKLLVVSSEGKSQAEAIKAFDYIRELRQRYNNTNGEEGAYVVAVNGSWGHEGLFEEDFQLMCDMYNDLGQVGILSVGSTENDQANTDVFGDIPSDCSSDFLIIVTNTDQNDELSVAGFGKKNVDLGAPGEDIIAPNLGNTYKATYGGTSYAAPHVAGAIGLIYSLEEGTFCDDAQSSPEEAILNLKRYILDGVKPLPTLKDKTVSEGRLDLTKTIEMVTGVYDLTNRFVRVYPNPTERSIFLDLSEIGEKSNIQITDVTGKVLAHKRDVQPIDAFEINVASWPQGSYFIKVSGDHNTSTVKFLKMR